MKSKVITKRGAELIRDPVLNKGTAFSRDERDAFGLHGLLPATVTTIENQHDRMYSSLARSSPLDTYVDLAALHDRNETLFYRVLMDHLDEFMPIVYTPTVGLATERFSKVFRRGRGIWITPDMAGSIADVIRDATAQRDIRLMVVTDSESILGIGDQGAGGMAISVGKLALYVAGAGFDPATTLPVCIDVGTNNEELLDDPLYLGWRERRLTGDAYDAIVDEFVSAVQTGLPQALLQWEDFRKDTAARLLTKHRHHVLSFNDDIQGTGAIAYAAVQSALAITGENIRDARVVIHGAGAAGLGMYRQVLVGMQDAGLAPDDARARIAVLDSRGLLVNDNAIRDAYKSEMALSVDAAKANGIADEAERHLHAVVERFEPNVIIGASGQAGAFDETLVRSMAAKVERPIILPFSNPTSISEAEPKDLLTWTDGRALIATGSPFDPVELGERRYEIGQGNNVFIFPGLGLGAVATQSKSVSDLMATSAANALALAVTEEERQRGLIFPAVTRLREVTLQVARAVARQAADEGLARIELDEALRFIDEERWDPEYVPYAAG